MNEMLREMADLMRQLSAHRVGDDEYTSIDCRICDRGTHKCKCFDALDAMIEKLGGTACTCEECTAPNTLGFA